MFVLTMKKVVIFCLLISAISLPGKAQININPNNGFEIGRLEYGLMPSVGDVQFQKTHINVGGGFKVGAKSLLGLRMGYTYIDTYYKENPNFVGFEDFEDIHLINLNVFYRLSLNNDWAFNIAFMPVLSSTLKASISSEDVIFNSMSSFTKKWQNSSNRDRLLTFGLLFGTQFGAPRLLPLINYTHQINEKSRYVLGLPTTGFFYTIDKKNSIDFTIRPEGFFVNNPSTNSFQPNTVVRDANLQFNAFRFGIGYNLKFNTNWVTHFNLGFIPTSNLEVVDNDNNTLYDFNADASVFFSVALSFNINRKQNEN